MRLKRYHYGTLVVLYASFLWGASRTEDVNATSLDKSDHLIVAGVKVGPVRLGEKKEQVMQEFPFKPGTDQQWLACGTTYNWVDSSQGNVFMEFRDGIVTQVESETPRYRTPEGLTSYMSPEKVKHFYKGLEAYTLPIGTSVALGDQPVIFWVSKEKGIAFEFAYYPEKQKRYLYGIIIFKPQTSFCIDNVTLETTGVQKLLPYSLGDE